jgi:tetratricopeptide (TPR) repeat protein
MSRLIRYLLLCCCALLLLTPAVAQDDDDDGGGGKLDADTQWKFCQRFWDNRNYADFAAFAIQYAEANPDHANVLDAWWRIYEVYRNHRPSPENKKKVYPKAIAACERWEKKSDKKMAANGLYYHALLVEREGNRPQGISLLTDLTQKYPDQAWAYVYWTLAEWLRESNRHLEAAEAYETFFQKDGYSDLSGHAVTRAGWSYQALGKRDDAIRVWNRILDKGFNIGWGGVHWNVVDIGDRLKGMGEDDMAKKFAMHILEKGSQDWADLRARALNILGEKPIKRIYIYPHFYYYFSTDKVNLTPNMNMDLAAQYNLLVRATYITKESPFNATLTVNPKSSIDSAPKNMTAEDADGKKSFTAKIDIPNDKGGIQGDWWYNFVHKEKAQAPGGLIISRKWEKAGNTWGQCTITITASQHERWNIYIYMPNEKTNVNNLSLQPNEVRDGGKTFLWYGWYDLSKGWVIKFPVEVGAGVAEYYPKIFMDRGIGINYQNTGGSGAEVKYDMKEYAFKLISETAFPYTIQFPGYQGVTLEEVRK